MTDTPQANVFSRTRNVLFSNVVSLAIFYIVLFAVFTGIQALIFNKYTAGFNYDLATRTGHSPVEIVPTFGFNNIAYILLFNPVIFIVTYNFLSSIVKKQLNLDKLFTFTSKQYWNYVLYALLIEIAIMVFKFGPLYILGILNYIMGLASYSVAPDFNLFGFITLYIFALFSFLFLYIRLFMVTYLIKDKNIGALKAIKVSWTITKKHIKTLATRLFILIICSIVAIIIYSTFLAIIYLLSAGFGIAFENSIPLTSVVLPLINGVISVITSAALTIAVLQYWGIFWLLTYQDLALDYEEE